MDWIYVYIISLWICSFLNLKSSFDVAAFTKTLDYGQKCFHMIHVLKVRLMLEWRNILVQVPLYFWLFLFDSFEQQFVLASCIAYYMQSVMYIHIHVIFNSAFSFRARIHTILPNPHIYILYMVHCTLYTYTLHTYCIAHNNNNNKKNSISKYLARLICFFLDSHFFGYYLFIFSLFLTLAMSVYACVNCISLQAENIII